MYAYDSLIQASPFLFQKVSCHLNAVPFALTKWLEKLLSHIQHGVIWQKGRGGKRAVHQGL